MTETTLPFWPSHAHKSRSLLLIILTQKLLSDLCVKYIIYIYMYMCMDRNWVEVSWGKNGTESDDPSADLFRGSARVCCQLNLPPVMN